MKDKKECIPCKGKTTKKPCVDCLTKQEEEIFSKLQERKDQNKLTFKQREIVIKQALKVLGTNLSHGKFAAVESFNFWIDKINTKLN